MASFRLIAGTLIGADSLFCANTGSSAVPLRTVVELAGLKPEDVRVEAVVGKVDAGGSLEEALQRGRLYADAGADMVLIHSKAPHPEEVLAFADYRAQNLKASRAEYEALSKDPQSPDALRGRVMSTQFLLQRLAGALGVAAVGASADAWGLRAPLICGAALALLVWIATFRARRRISESFSAREP